MLDRRPRTDGPGEPDGAATDSSNARENLQARLGRLSDSHPSAPDYGADGDRAMNQRPPRASDQVAEPTDGGDEVGRPDTSPDAADTDHPQLDNAQPPADSKDKPGRPESSSETAGDRHETKPADSSSETAGDRRETKPADASSETAGDQHETKPADSGRDAPDLGREPERAVSGEEAASGQRETKPADASSETPNGPHETEPADSGRDAPDLGRDPERAVSGWETADARDHPDRPVVSEIHVPPDRVQHILEGDGPGKFGGGHRHGTGRPGKTEFPESWSDDAIISTVEEIARQPETVEWQRNNRWHATGERDGVRVTAVVLPDGRIWTAWPWPGGPGVTKNPKEGDA
jgi:hypothetical protein